MLPKLCWIILDLNAAYNFLYLHAASPRDRGRATGDPTEPQRG
jgi:hypothetical protein